VKAQEARAQEVVPIKDYKTEVMCEQLEHKHDYYHP